MHFSIPETQEAKEGSGSSYTNYCLRVNGSPHCLVRYRQLRTLDDQLRSQLRGSFDLITGPLPPFPPKKLFPLTSSQIEERRIALEKYFQLIAQDERLYASTIFKGFLIGAQQETAGVSVDQVNLEIYYMNEQKIIISGLSIMQTDQVMEKICSQVGIPNNLSNYFALFFTHRNDDGIITIVKKLQSFESPYISLKSSHNCHQKGGNIKLVLRKSSWDPDIDNQLLTNKITLNLLYIQTLSDVERGWVVASNDTKKTLARMQARGAKREYMDVAKELKFYGYIHFLPCLCDYPITNTPCQVSIGVRELVIRIVDTVTGETKEGSFKVTKMRCWRIMTLTNPIDDDANKLELSFEYLMSNNTLQWITIVSSQAILMSVCLQSMIEELLRKKNQLSNTIQNEEKSQEPENNELPSITEYAYQRRDGSYQTLPIRNSFQSNQTFRRNEDHFPKNVNLKSMSGYQYSVKKLSEKFDVVNMREASKAAEDVFIENEAFIDICDEKL